MTLESYSRLECITYVRRYISLTEYGYKYLYNICIMILRAICVIIWWLSYIFASIHFGEFNSQFPMVIMLLLGSSQTLANKQKLKWTVYARGNLSTSSLFPTEENQINKFGLDVRLMTMLDYVWNVYFYWVTRCISMSCQEEFICHYLCVL